MDKIPSYVKVYGLPFFFNLLHVLFPEIEPQAFRAGCGLGLFLEILVCNFHEHF